MDEQKDIILKFLGYFPIVSAFSLAFGVLDLSIYYSHYNINILPYLDFEEIISQSLADILPALGLLIAARLFRFLFLAHGPNAEREDLLNAQIMDEPSFSKAIKGYFKISPYLWAYVVNLLFFPFLLIFANTQRQIIFFVLLFSAIMLLISILPGEIQRVHNKRYNRFLANQYIFLLYFSLALMAVAVYKGMSKRMDTDFDKKKYLNYIVIDNKRVTSNDHYFYVGKSKNYVFFHNKEIGNSDVFPIGTISKLSLKD